MNENDASRTPTVLLTFENRMISRLC